MSFCGNVEYEKKNLETYYFSLNILWKNILNKSVNFWSVCVHPDIAIYIPIFSCIPLARYASHISFFDLTKMSQIAYDSLGTAEGSACVTCTYLANLSCV